MEETVDPPLVHREQELFLAREIQVDRALGEPRLVGDLGDARDALGRACKDPLCGVENRVAALAFVLGLHGPVANGHQESLPCCSTHN